MAGRWVFVAAYILGSKFYLSIDGKVASANVVNRPDAIAAILIGGIDTSSNYYLDDLRVTNGVSRYGASDFTPPTAPFPEVAC
jgi:hypothetical protein